MATNAKSVMDIGIVKSGAAGRPRVTVMVDGAVPLEAASAGMLKHITRNKDLRKKLGLKACLTCISGMDFDIRHKFDQVMQIDLNSLGR
jgi:hypothetical protein